MICRLFPNLEHVPFSMEHDAALFRKLPKIKAFSARCGCAALQFANSLRYLQLINMLTSHAMEQTIALALPHLTALEQLTVTKTAVSCKRYILPALQKMQTVTLLHLFFSDEQPYRAHQSWVNAIQQLRHVQFLAVRGIDMSQLYVVQLVEKQPPPSLRHLFLDLKQTKITGLKPHVQYANVLLCDQVLPTAAGVRYLNNWCLVTFFLSALRANRKSAIALSLLYLIKSSEFRQHLLGFTISPASLHTLQYEFSNYYAV